MTPTPPIHADAQAAKRAAFHHTLMIGSQVSEICRLGRRLDPRRTDSEDYEKQAWLRDLREIGERAHHVGGLALMQRMCDQAEREDPWAGIGDWLA
jgi:hypothetical protein